MIKEPSETRILLVEDDTELSVVTSMQLKSRGYMVESALNGKQAMDMLLSKPMDLILLDVQLPDVDGHELCKRIRGEEGGYEGPIIFMSCLGDSGNIVDAFREGGNDYIVKPAKLETLIERIRTNLEKDVEKQEKGRRLWFKQFMVDTKSRSVYRVRNDVRGEKIDLSKTEYDILQALASQPDEILLYRQIYQTVWGQEDLGDVRTLMVHVSNLRKKIDENHTEIIRAIRGVGYLFQDV